MHISDGFIGLTQCAIGYGATACALTAIAVKTEEENIPKIALMSAAFFASSLIHLKIGATSIHFTLIGLIGIILGWHSIIAIFTGLLFQMAMFSHGGITTLGINTLIFTIPAMLTYMLIKSLAPLKPSIKLFSLFCAVGSFLAITVASFLVYIVILTSGQGFHNLAIIFSLSNFVLSGLEAIVTYFIIKQILLIKPSMINSSLWIQEKD